MKPRASYVKTWERMHGQWFGASIPVLPLTPEILKGVGAMYKAGRYRNFSNPLSSMKGLHLEMGYDWSDLLALTAKRVERSVTRGIGPAAQCRSLNLTDVAELRLGTHPVTADGPIGPANMTIVGSFFMLREIEASLALWGSIGFDYNRKLVCWNLPASKADPQALGKSRTWGCTCAGITVGDEAVQKIDICPFHSLLCQRDAVAHMLELEYADLAEFPVFPNAAGEACDKSAVVATFRAVAELLGMHPDETKDIKGHLCRVSGAQHLAMLGFDIVLIQLMARWASEVVLRYIAEAPLGAITSTYRNLAAGRSLASQLDSIMVEISDLRVQLASMSAATATELASERTLSSSVAQYSEECLDATYLVNNSSGKIHIPFIGRDALLVTGRAKCGWRFSSDEHSVITQLPRAGAPMIRGVCLPKHRRACSIADASDSAPTHSLVDTASSSSS